MWWYKSTKVGKVTREKNQWREKKLLGQSEGRIEILTNSMRSEKPRKEKKREKTKKEKKAAEHSHIVIHVTNSPNNTLQIVLSWEGCSSLRLILSMYSEFHIH